MIELDAHIKEEGCDRHLLTDEKLLGGTQCLKTHLGIGLPGRFMNYTVIVSTLPSGAVVAAFRKKEVEEGIGIGIIPHPTGTGYPEIKRAK